VGNNEFFGNTDQQAVMRKAAALWQIVADDKRFQTHGRVVGINHSEGAGIETHAALARLQGAAPNSGMPASEAAQYAHDLEAAGFKTDRFEEWQGDETPVEAARAVLAQNRLADDLTPVFVDEHTPPEELSALAEFTQSCEVLLPMGKFMRGIGCRSVCIYARDGNGAPVGSTASVASAHPDSATGHTAWWGMLATDVARRGEKIALILGAMSIIAMHERHGFSSFSTGIRQGNSASERLCTKLGLSPMGKAVIVAIDPAVFAGSKMTK